MEISSSKYSIMAIICLLLILLNLARSRNSWNRPSILCRIMLPTCTCFPVSFHIYDLITYVLIKCTNNGTFLFWKVMLFTSHPKDIQHIMSSNFWNYPKGFDTKSIFDSYGEFLFTTDHHEWRKQREIAHSFFNDQGLHKFAPKVNFKILSEGLVPVLDHASEKVGMVIDLQDVFKRFMLDATSMIATGYNHGSLRIGLPEDEFLTALHQINEGILMRHILPERLWKFQRLLGIGKEKKLVESSEIIDRIISKDLDRINKISNNNEEDDEFNAIKFTANLGIPDEIKIDIVKILLFGGTDTASSALTWFFSLVLENPGVVNKIREEIREKTLCSSPARKAGIHILTEPKELNKLVYLHAAILETMRLYPPAPFHSRTSVEQDILPGGQNRVSSGMKVIPCYYSMGRMESIWGKDCLQFKPERWISEKGNIIPVPANKFVAFGLGPRTCLGRILGLIRLKAAAATIIHKYDIQIIDDHSTTTFAASIFLEMKYGLKGMIKKRSTS